MYSFVRNITFKEKYLSFAALIAFARSYREFPVLLEISPPLQELLGLQRLPHFAPLYKFLLQTKSRRLEHLSPFFLGEYNGVRLALDSIGLSPTSASCYSNAHNYYLL